LTEERVTSDTISGRMPEPTVLFEAKFEGVRCSGEILARPRLTQVLAQSGPALVLLAAPPGFGKTTLLAQWRELDGRAFTCVSLDATDNDPVVFWRYLVEAIRKVEPSFGGAVLSALGIPRVDVLNAVVPAVLNELESVSEQIVLVLDDYQTIASRACHDSVAFFLERRPRNVTLAISTRADPPIAIGRLRATGELLELRAVDLCFTHEEEAEFLNDTLKLGLCSESVAVLHERTEGWPVGVHLASLSLRKVSDRAAMIARFGGSSRHVVDYLAEVVLDTLDPEPRQFLLETSVLQSMCGPLCDVVTGREDSADLLLEIERANLFLIPLDDRREWYRYHQLFAEVLRNQLLRRNPDHARELHRRASQWLAGEGYTFEAVRHAIAAGELDAAARVVTERWVSLLVLGRAETILRCLEVFPAEVVERDAQLSLVKAWALSMLNRRDEALEALGRVEAADGLETLPDGSSLEALTALVRAWFPCGDARGMLAAATCAHKLEGERTSVWQPVVLLALGWARYFGSEPEEARSPLIEAALLATRASQWPLACVAKAVLSRVCLAVDDLAAAESAAREAMEIVEGHGLADHPGSGVAYTAQGAVLARDGDLDEGSRLLGRGLARLRAHGEELYLADALLALAPARRALGARDEARALLAEARALIENCPDPGMLSGRLEEVTRTIVPAHRRINGDSELTERELEVLRYLADGLPKREIGEALFLSFNTIHSHTKSIYQKLRVSSRQAAVERARELGAL
jgi:LuxR family maltose regulon positive regulatory protein